ncbi:hypothetical protein NL676_010081 [Syzygium grande]|nr:hypothetical protein NL676_010081 [Syzygium grande]
MLKVNGKVGARSGSGRWRGHLPATVEGGCIGRRCTQAAEMPLAPPSTTTDAPCRDGETKANCGCAREREREIQARPRALAIPTVDGLNLDYFLANPVIIFFFLISYTVIALIMHVHHLTIVPTQ